jgi:hypothetical protein
LGRDTTQSKNKYEHVHEGVVKGFELEGRRGGNKEIIKIICFYPSTPQEKAVWLVRYQRYTVGNGLTASTAGEVRLISPTG